MAEHQFIQFKRDGGRADLILSNPPKNMLNVRMLEEIIHSLESIRDDDSLKVLVIRGSGGTFCGGIETESLQADKVGLLMPLYTRLFVYMNEVRGLVLAGVEGDVLGAGCELACFCDVVIAAHSTRFGFPEVTMGLFPPIATAVVPRLIGRARAMDWIISGEVFSAEKAYQSRLVTRVVLEDKLTEKVEHYAERIASFSAPAVTLAKRAVDRALYSPVMEALRTTESTYMLDLMNSIDPHEGIRAALEKRAPNWRNK